MGMLSRTALLLSVVALWNCDVLAADHPFQKASLETIFYRGNPMPPPPTEDEIRDLEMKFRTAPFQEIELLTSIFAGNSELMVYATRDSDRDGTFDFRVSENTGKFFEGDLDVDGDGIRNVYDSEPYIRSVGGKDITGDGVPDDPGSFEDQNLNGIPDHVDWMRSDLFPEKTFSMIVAQTRLFEEGRILLVDRSDEWSEPLVEAVSDAVFLLFHGIFAKGYFVPTLRTIAVDVTLDPRPGEPQAAHGPRMVPRDPQDEDETHAVADFHGQSISFFRSVKAGDSVVLFGTAIHELAHAYQFLLDYDSTKPQAENRRDRFPAPKFFRLLGNFGFSALKTEREEISPTLFRPHFSEVEVSIPYYENRNEELRLPSPASLNDWKAWLSTLSETSENWGADPRVRSRHIFGLYAMTNHWEWHADALLAHTLISMLDALKADFSDSQWKRHRDHVLDVVEAAWPDFFPENIRGAPIRPHFKSAFGLDESAVQSHARKYVTVLDGK